MIQLQEAHNLQCVNDRQMGDSEESNCYCTTSHVNATAAIFAVKRWWTGSYTYVLNQSDLHILPQVSNCGGDTGQLLIYVSVLSCNII